MKDNTKAFSAEEINEFTKLHGHTKIELTDIKTGKKKVVEHDNDFQAGVLASYMRSMGAYNNNPYANDTWAGQPIWRNLCGGIFCFENAIDNSGGEVEYMPAGNKMVANGAYGVTNGGTPTELGSYNSNESSTSGNDSITFVYEFNSSQGNGTIGCVCLTTEIGGYIGYGNPSGGATSTKKSLTANQSSKTAAGIAIDNYVLNFGGAAVDTANKTITMTKTPKEITKGSIFDNLSETVTKTWSGDYPWSAPVGTYGDRAYIAPFDEDEIIIIPNHSANVATGDKIYYLTYNVTSDTLTEKNVTNNTGHTLILNAGNSQSGTCVLGNDGKNIYVMDTDYTLYAINLTTGTPKAIDYTFNNRPAQWWWNPQYIESVGGRITDDLMFMDDYRGGSYHAEYVDTGIVDAVNGTRYPINSTKCLHNSKGLDVMQNFYHYGYTQGAIGMYKNPLILSTINNLDTPVTKTAAQTMKITYTLSKASE